MFISIEYCKKAHLALCFTFLVRATKYQSFYSFCDWIKDGVFELAKGGRVKVGIERLKDFEEGAVFAKCKHCTARFEESEIVDAVKRLDWESVDDVNLKHVVSVRIDMIAIQVYICIIYYACMRAYPGGRGGQRPQGVFNFIGIIEM